MKKAEKKEEKAEEKHSRKAEKEKDAKEKSAQKPAKEAKEKEPAKEAKEKEPAKEAKEKEPAGEEGKKPAGEKPAKKEEGKKPGEKEDAKEEHGEKPDLKEEHGEKEHAEEKRKPKREKPKRGRDSGKVNFVELLPKEIVEAIIHLANEGHSQSEIGMILRDQYGIPKVSKAMGKKIGKVLEENKLLAKIPEDLMDLIRKNVNLRGHLEKNRKDMSAKRGLMLTVSKIRALEKYYKKKGKLPLNWRYTPETAALLAK